MLFGAALLAIAVAAPSASAIADFPHEEEPSKWTAVAVYDYNTKIAWSEPCDGASPGGANCSSNGVAPVCRSVTFGIYSVAPSCNATLKGDVGFNGEFSVAGFLEQGVSTGLICRHTATHEYWLRLEGSKGALMFGNLTSEPSGIGGFNPDFLKGLSFGMPGGMTKRHNDSSVTYYGAEFGSMWKEKEILIGAYGSQPCGWPEL